MSLLHTLSSGYLSEDKRDSTKKTLYSEKFKSNLKVFSDHDGFIDGELHTIIGTKGSGKSTWSKTILSELIYNNKSVFLYISEERKNKYLLNLNENMLRIHRDEEKLAIATDCLTVFSEVDQQTPTVEQVFELIKIGVERSESEIILFDNFTTSFMSELPINQQSKILRAFKSLADKLNIPIIMLFHTGKLTQKNNLDGDNVRGSGTAINIGSYNYIIAQHQDGSVLRNFIYTEKARYHSRANKKMYEMTYNHKVGLFTDCKEYYKADFEALVSGKKRKEDKNGFF